MEYQLGESGRQHVLARMGTGLSLAQRVLKLRRAARIWAYLPKDTPIAIRDDLERGGLSEREKRRAKLLEFVALHLERAPTNCAIVEDYLARPGDRILAETPVPYFVYRDEIYDYLPGADHPREGLEALIAAGRSYRLTMVLSQLPGEMPLEISDSTLLAIASAAKTVVLDAWHNEGEIFCDLEGSKALSLESAAGGAQA